MPELVTPGHGQGLSPTGSVAGLGESLALPGNVILMSHGDGRPSHSLATQALMMAATPCPAEQGQPQRQARTVTVHWAVTVSDRHGVLCHPVAAARPAQPGGTLPPLSARGQ